MNFEYISNDIHLSNPHLPSEDIDDFMSKCIVWEWPWGVIFSYKNDMHIHVLSEYRKKVFLRKPLRTVTRFMFLMYPVLKTEILKTKPWAMEFDLKMGWKIKHETDTTWYLELRQEDFRYA